MFDEDANGRLDEDEFYLVLDHLGVRVSEERLEQLFHRFDADRSGYIDYDEFLSVWLSVRPTTAPCPPPCSPPAHPPAHASTAYRRARGAGAPGLLHAAPR